MNPTNLSLAQVRAGPVVLLTYYLPRRVFWHFCLWQGLRRLGFKAVCVVKLNHHHVWDVRLRASTKLNDKAVRRLRRELRKLCAMHGPSIKPGELTIVRDGSLFEVALIWPVGEAGLFNWRSLQSATADTSVPAAWN